MCPLDAQRLVRGGYIGGGAREGRIAVTAGMALDHRGEEGVWTRRAKGVGKLYESDGYSTIWVLPERHRPYTFIELTLSASCRMVGSWLGLIQVAESRNLKILSILVRAVYKPSH